MRERFGLTLGVNTLQLLFYITCDDPVFCKRIHTGDLVVPPKHLSDEAVVPLTAYAKNNETKSKDSNAFQAAYAAATMP